jgi:alpha-L-rhamnosidase
VLFALADNGYADTAYRMLLNDTCPSWLYEVKAGATTVWERWDALRPDGSINTGINDGTHGMLSFNHFSYGAVGDFLYRRVLGLEPAAPTQSLEPGWKHFRFAPLIPAAQGIAWAKGSHKTAFGTIEAEWHADGDQHGAASRYGARLVVPEGCVCDIALPWGFIEPVGGGTYRFG